MRLIIYLIMFLSSTAYGQTTSSPNMGLPVPQVGVTPGPAWAQAINDSLNIIDSHDHTPGSGVQITPLGMNISSDLSFQDHNATILRSSIYDPQSAPLALATDIGSVYVSGVDLYYNDVNGNQIRLTQGGGIVGTSGSITGLVSPASASYVSGTQTFVWQSGVNIAANMDARNYILRNSSVSSNGLTLQAPTLSSDYTITLPLLPASQKFMTLDASGNMTAPWAVDNSTIEVNSNTVQVKAGGITATQIANNTITNAQVASKTLAYAALATGFDGIYNVTTEALVVPSFNVRVATTANGTLSTAFDNGSPIDGVTLATNDLILIKNQTTTTDNGVYVVQASGAPVRDTSYDTFTELNYAAVHVTAGTVNSGTDWGQNNVLTSLADAQSWSKAQTFAFTVPAHVTTLFVKAAGGGGGGGGGAGGGSNGGGSGGVGATPYVVTLSVTPADVISITVGAGGSGGAGGVGANNGGVGTSGLVTSIVGTGIAAYFPAGSGGAAGLNTGTGGASVSTFTETFAGVSAGASGAGGGTSTSGSSAIRNNYVVTAAAGGANSGTSGGGGGGGSGFGAGGAGGAGNNVANGAAGSSPSSTNYGGGGGGGGAGAGNGGAGGKGANGGAVIYWLGTP